ncbi:MAG: FprA family A-type flavoprotein [Desulfobacterium sp.]|nr:FprA family A-type flavoprotein [Desulfobacterium sp.]
MYKPVEITKNIYNVGCRDWDIRDFHGYSTYQGTTYNAFLIVDEKGVLVDTVKKEFSKELLDNISKIIDPEKIDIVISNHTEMDHSGALPAIMHRIGADKPVYCSKMGKKNLESHFTGKLNLISVDNGQELALGERTLSFMETKMLHWPDSMFTYVKEDGILFSSDAFGQHYAGDAMFDDEIGDTIMEHSAKYFANILLNYAPRVEQLITKVVESGLAINMICPDHGIIWRKDPGAIINAYLRWSKQECIPKALIVFDTMWKSTATMAREIARGVESQGVRVRVMNTRKCHRSDIMTEMLDAKALVMGSPTLNNGIFPVVADVLTYIKGLRPKNRMAVAFGSFGWSGEAVKILNKEFEAMDLEIVDPGLAVKYVPDSEDLVRCFDLGATIGQKVAESFS